MRKNLKLSSFYLALLTSVLTSGCMSSQEELLEQARKKINRNYLSYHYRSIWPNAFYPYLPADTSKQFMEIVQAVDDLVGFRYRAQLPGMDIIYGQDTFKTIDHRAKTLTVYTNAVENASSSTFNLRVNNLAVQWSPVILLNKQWHFLADTVVGQRNFKIYVHHPPNPAGYSSDHSKKLRVLINSTTALLEQFEELTYEGESISKKIVQTYNSYQFDTDEKSLIYKVPTDYEVIFAN